ncbi:MAG: M24 family metallopeptidase [Candidatus Zixiibacteriota bacterium]
MSAKRISQLRKLIHSENLDALVVNHLDHIRYLTGFTGSAGLLVVSTRGADFLTDSRYTEQAGRQVKGARVTTIKSDPIVALAGFDRLNKKNARFGFDSEHLSVAQKRRLKVALDKVLLVEAGAMLSELGWVKEASELASIEKAVAVSDTAFERILALVAPGIREMELAAELEYQMTMLGSEKPAFETIVASGYRSAMPHGIASRKKIQKGDFITFDFGATVDGYVSDITRTVVVGKATARQKKIYQLVLKSHLAGIRKVKAGVAAHAVDDACRRIITRAGYGKNFGHGTGHGIGFYVHVGPRLGPGSTDILKNNHVITIEPGIYIPGWGGVRIEDDVAVRRSSGRPLNRSPKKLLEL